MIHKDHIVNYLSSVKDSIIKTVIYVIILNAFLKCCVNDEIIILIKNKEVGIYRVYWC